MGIHYLSIARTLTGTTTTGQGGPGNKNKKTVFQHTSKPPISRSGTLLPDVVDSHTQDY